MLAGILFVVLYLGLAKAAIAEEPTQLGYLDEALGASEALPSPSIPHPHPSLLDESLRPADAAPAVERPRRHLVITLGGDLGLNAHAQPAEADGARRHGTFLRWSALTAGIAPLIDGDLNFANLETVVTASNTLAAEDKAFVFRSHPAGVRHLVGLGFNLLSTANNHAIDYGLAGIGDTISHLEVLEGEGRLKAHAGVGVDRDAAGRPRIVLARGASVAFSAIGIASGGRAGANRPGQMAWRSPDDVSTSFDRLAAAPADYRILSVHHGQERDPNTAPDAIRTLRHEALLSRGIDLVAGHHAHVAQGIELTDGRLIFYGLGNLLHPGMQDMGSFGLCQDYGLFARIHLSGAATGRLAVHAVEVVPLVDMHWQARAMPAERATQRVHVLNYLASFLDDPSSGARGLRFAPQPDGSGLACLAGASDNPGRIGSLCKDWSGPPVTPAALRTRIASACQHGPVLATSARPSSPPAARRTTAPANPAAPSVSSDQTWLRSVFNSQ